ncbi:MAG: HTH-type transcriptional regulator BetI [Luteibacter sp.]|nr:MAG: HTH-type transcriptional regulator BetI [Luteibacter sp.]
MQVWQSPHPTPIIEWTLTLLSPSVARPLSPEKRLALLQSAVNAVADLGVLASTASIARGAGVAEGTLFTYFETKENLLQALYLHLKQGLADTMTPDYPREADYQERARHVFQRYVDWGLSHGTERTALARLTASGLILEATRLQGMEAFADVAGMIQQAIDDGVFIDAPLGLLSSVIEDIAGRTIEYVERFPAEAERHRELGFRMVWAAVKA